MAAGKVLLTGAFGLVLAIMLNSQQLLREAQQRPFGGGRDASMAIWEPVEGAASAVGLHLPRLWAEEALGRDVLDPGTTTGPVGSAAVVEADGEAGEADAPVGGVVVADRPASAAGTAGADRDGSADGSSGTGAAATGTSGISTGTSSGEATPGETQQQGVGTSDDGAASAPATTVPWFPTPDDPLRLHILGDSMVQFFGHVMVGLANDSGVIEATTEHQLSSGLSRPDFYDWPARIVEAMASEAPDAVVVMFGGNDAQAIVVDGQIARPFSDAWTQEYSARVGHVMDLVTTDPDRLLIWVGQPIMERPDYDEKMRRISEIYAAEAATRDRVRYVDIRSLFRGPNGGYSRYVADPDGQIADVRLSDGIHLSTVGGRWLSQVLLDELGTLVDLTSASS